MDQHLLSIISRMFSASVFNQLAQNGESAIFGRLVSQLRLYPGISIDGTTVADVFDKSFEILKKPGNRDEYVYRSALTDKILLGRHSLRSATMLKEFRTGKSKADVVILNGTSTVYEIKSERDTLARLEGQIASYSEVFATINVITSESQYQDVLRATPDSVGVLALTPRFQISTKREAQTDPDRIDPLAILDSIRVDEAFDIIHSLGIDFPEVPNTRVRECLRGVFRELEPSLVHDKMVQTLRESRSGSSLIEFLTHVPVSVRSAALGYTNKRNQDRFKIALATPIDQAYGWK